MARAPDVAMMPHTSSDDNPLAAVQPADAEVGRPHRSDNAAAAAGATEVFPASTFESEAPGVLATILTTYAHVAEAPANWHQATIFCLASKNPDEAAVAPRMALAGVVMVLFQVLTAIGVIASTTFPSCQTNDQCEHGAWCDVAGDTWNAYLHEGTGTQRCHVCGDDLPLPLQISADGKSWNQPDGTLPDGTSAMPTFAGYNLTTVEIICREPTADAVGITGMGEHVLFTTAAVSSWCEACVHPTTFHVNPMTYVSRSESNAAVMRPVDWIALVFSSYMVGLTVAGEVKDIRVCEIARERAGDAIAPQWRRALILTNGARRWIFLCAFGWIIPNLVALKGGDALNICLNTIAIVFLAEVDNVSFLFGLGERLRGRIERAGAGHTILSDDEKLLIARTKTAHTLCVMFCVNFSIVIMNMPCSVATQVMGQTLGEGIDKTNACGLGALIGTFFSLINWGWISALTELVALRELTLLRAMEGIAKGIGGFVACFALFATSMD